MHTFLIRSHHFNKLLQNWIKSFSYLVKKFENFILQKPEYGKFYFCGCANSENISLPKQTKLEYVFQLGEPVSFRSCIVIVRIVMILEMIIRYL